MSYQWTYQYNDNTIIVRNDTAIELIVNGQVQDKKDGIKFSAELSGRLGTGEEIKVSLGGVWKIKCNLFIDNVLQSPTEEK